MTPEDRDAIRERLHNAYPKADDVAALLAERDEVASALAIVDTSGLDDLTAIAHAVASLAQERDAATLALEVLEEEHDALRIEVERLNLLRTIDRAEITRFNLARRPTNTVESLILIATDPAMSLGVQDTARECLQLCGFPLDHLNAAGALLRSMETSR